MKLVIDTNILFSFFKVYSYTRKLISNPVLNLELYSPKFTLKELEKYFEEINRKTKMNIGTFEFLKRFLPMFIKFVPLEEYRDFLEQAAKELITIDPNDVDFLALSLKLNCPIWSNDPHFKKQSLIKAFSTKELTSKLKELNLS